MSYRHDTPENVALLAQLFGFEAAAAHGWLSCETQQYNNPTNPLNIRHSPTEVGRTAQGFSVFRSATDGLHAAHSLVAALAPSYGYGAILAQANSHDAFAQAKAVEMSSWAAGHYGGTATASGCIRRYVTSNPTPAPAPQETDVITAQVRQRWTPTTNPTTGASNGVLRGTADRSAPIVARVPLTGSIVTVAEVKTIDGANGDWRLVETFHADNTGRTPLYALRSDWNGGAFEDCAAPVPAPAPEVIVLTVDGKEVYRG